MPIRIQRRRSRGWSAREAAGNDLPIVYVHRPRELGNPYRAPATPDGRRAATLAYATALRDGRLRTADGDVLTIRDVVEETAGCNVACFCPTDQWCHGEVILALAAGRHIKEIIDEIRRDTRYRPVDPSALGVGNLSRGEGH